MNKLFLTLAIVLVFAVLATADVEKKNKYKPSAEVKASFNSCKDDCDTSYRTCKNSDVPTQTARQCRYDRYGCRNQCIALHEAQIVAERSAWEASQGTQSST